MWHAPRPIPGLRCQPTRKRCLFELRRIKPAAADGAGVEAGSAPFDDASLDAVLSSDVFEHLADAYGAHREIFRVLCAGGRHIFTVPFMAGSERDDLRAKRLGARVEYLAEPLYHGDPVRPGEGVLVWRIFGQEMLTRLREIGFKTETIWLRIPRHGILGEGAVVFVARKP